MFDKINTLFLLALAFTAWIVYCYFHAIEEQKSTHDFNVELYTEHPGFTDERLNSEFPPTSVPPSFFTFEMMGTLLIGLCLTYSLFKVLKVVLARAQQFWQGKEQEKDSLQDSLQDSLEDSLQDSLEDSLQDSLEDSPVNEKLWEQLNLLRDRHQMMGDLLKQVQSSGVLDLQTSESASLEAEQIRGSGYWPLQTRGCLELQPLLSSTTGSEVHIQTETVNMELVRQSRQYAIKPSVSLQVSDNFNTGSKHGLMVEGSSCAVGLPPS